MAEPLRSIDPVAEIARRERMAQARHFEALDTKAGIILGFAGALVALVVRESSTLVAVGRGLAAASALLSLAAFYPRRYPVIDLEVLRDRYLRAEESFTRLTVLDTEVVMVSRGADLLRVKGRRLKLAIVALALAVAFVAVGAVIG